jgi:hypothetical protein
LTLLARYIATMKSSRALTWLLAAALLVPLCPAAQAAGFWPFKSNKGKHAAVTMHGAEQHQLKPLGNQLRVVKPIGNNRKPPKTIVAKRPP